MLALSWSPTYCDRDGADRGERQCDEDADHRFVVHGLWPNSADGAPSRCRSRWRGPSRAMVRGMLDIMPSEGLIRHQWRKHGTCSGLSPEDYFGTVREAYERVTIPAGLATLRDEIRVRPDVLRAAFRRANEGLDEPELFIRCGGGMLVEVRMCMAPSLDFVDCPNVRHRRCRSRTLNVEPPD
ncbi:MAG: ribonuclease T2 [Pseudomonadota bacterium]